MVEKIVNTDTNQNFSNLINPFTNKPVQTGKSVSFNQNIYNSTNYMETKNSLLDDLNKGMTRPQVNQQALYNIPVVPEFMKDEYNEAYAAGNWLNSLNIATPDEIDEWRAKGKMGIGETAQRLKSLKSAKYVPFVGTTAEVGYNLDMLSAVNRLKKGQQISDLERDLLVDYLRELKEIQVRGTTLPSKTLSAILESIPFFIEFGTGVAAAPETFGGSLSVSGLALSKAAGKKAARKAVEKALSKAATESVMTGSKKAVSLSAAKSLYKSTYNEMLKAGSTRAAKEMGAKETAKIVAKTTPQSIIAANFASKPLTYMTAKNTIGGIADRQLSGSMQVSDAGEAVFLEPENMALSIMKSFGSSVFDNYTETMGWAFAPVTSYFAKPIRKILPQKFFTEFEKLVTSRYGMPAAQALKKYGYDGVIEEMGEELLNRFLCQTFGINGLDEYTFDGFMNNVFYANDPEQWLVEALSFAAMGAGAHGVVGSVSKIKEELERQGNEKAVKKLTELANKSIYSPAEFYLEQGLIKIEGSQSAAEQMLRKKFTENGVDNTTADEFFKTASELEIRNKLKEFIDADEMDAGKRREKAVDFLSNKMLENKSYVSKDKAKKNANLIVTALEKISETKGIPIEQLIEGEAPRIINQSDEFSAISGNEDNQLFQSAETAGAPEAETEDAKKEWNEKGTESKYFKQWFGDSKVVDENGEPLEVQHRTNREFDTFDKNTIRSLNLWGKGFYFSVKDSIDKKRDYGKNKMQCYLSLQNPFEADTKVTRKTFKTLIDNRILDEIFKFKDELFGDEFIFTVFNLRNENNNKQLKVDTSEILKELGYDGIHIEDTYIAFEPEQIKSVNNQGTFDSSNPNIYYQSEIDKDNIEKAFGDTVENIQEYIKDDILNIIADNNIGVDEFNLEDLRLYGSFTTGKNHKKSDLDVLVQYTGSMREDDAFNMFSGAKLSLTNAKNKKVKIDINPVNVEKSGTIDEKLSHLNSFNKNNAYYQSVYHGSPHRFDEFSLEHIGKGEGAQAHGWGLYFAENKEISESYRNSLANEKVYYDGKQVEDDTEYYYLKVARLGKANIIKELRKYIKRDEYYLKFKNMDFAREENIRLLEEYNRYKKLSKKYYKNANPTKAEQKKFEKETDNYNKVNDTLDVIENVFKLKFDFESLAKYIELYKKELKLYKKIDESKIKIDKGQLYKVDIPETDEMLDENKTFTEQPKKVQKAIKDVFNAEGEKGKELLKYILKYNYRGGAIYCDLRDIKAMKKLGENFGGRYINKFNTEFFKQASLLLNKHGIKGITYDGREDGRCYVVFDDKAVKVLETYYQEDYQENLFYDNLKARELRKVKGSYIPAENLIELFKNADESTVIHEFAHWWLDRLDKYSKDNEELALDMQAIRDFVKNDGGDFTIEQHEKFARGFEAYIRSGYAKNNRLKRIFEDFKNALLAIYDSIKKLGFKDDDMPQIQELFDRLLTTEKERIRTTVFDKIAQIDSKIETIQNNEPDEFKELNEIWKDNIELLNRKSDKKRKVDEYLELANKITSRETKEVKEFKKRYKEATLQILSAATGYNTRYIANPRNWERVQIALEHSDDKITTSGGLRYEWKDFYSDTGVSYENEEIDGDYKLAEQAFQVLVDGRYNKTFEENYDFEEIEKFSAKFDYLHAKVKTLKGEEKQAALEALYSLFNNLPSMPDEVTVSLFKKLEDVGREYEDEQRDDFNKKRYPSIPVVQLLQFYITNKLNALKVYNPETRYKMRLNKSHRLYRYIKNVNSVDEAKKQIRRINDFVIDDMRNAQRSLLHKEIQKQVRTNSKLVKVGTLTKGKFDWKTNTVFAQLVQMNKMTREEAQKELGSLVQIQDASKSEARDSFDENETGEFNKTNDFQDTLRKKFLQYRSMRIQDLDVTHTIQLLQDILELKEKGRQAKSEEDFINKTLKWNTKNNLLDVLEITKNSGAKYGANWIAGVGKITSLNGGTLANWESLLNAVFNKDTAQKYSLLQEEAKSEIYARKHMIYFYERAREIYGFKNPTGFDKFLDYDYMQPLIKLFQEYDAEKYMYVQQVFSVNSPEGYAKSNIEISRAQMITMFAWSLNEKLEQRLFTQFGLQQIREMFEEKLSKEDKELAWALVDTCEQMREDINDVFIRTTGLSLPAVENYFPSKAERVQSDIDMYHDFFVKSSSPSFIKERKTCNRIPMKPLSPLEILIPHINKTSKYVVMSEKTNFLNQIFKDTAIKTKMQEIWGSKEGADIYQTMINKLAACTFTNYSKGTNLVAGALDTLSRNYITSSIGFSAKVAIGQLLSVINYAENMPFGVWAKGFAETLKHPVDSFNYMLENCEYLQSRLGGNSQNEIISILTSEKDKFRTVRNFMTSNVKWGDIIAITLGGKPYVDYLIRAGMSKEEAFDKFVEDTLRAQQAGTTSSISEWQAAQAKNCLTRMFFAFRNTDIQYERKFIDTIIHAKKGEIGKKEAIKKIFIYKILNPFMFTSFLQNMSLIALFRGIFAGDDPDDTLGGLLKSLVEAAVLSGLTAYGFAGFIASSVVESIIAVFDKEYKHFEKNVPVMSDFDYQIQKYLKGDLSFSDYVDALAIGSELGLGIPSSKIVNTIEGALDIAQGNIGVGLSRMAGWGKYTSTKAWTGKAPEKKKKKRK